MVVPKSLHPEFEPVTESGDGRMLANVTPTGSCFFPHIDLGLDGLVQCLGPGAKLIAAWPNTEENILTLLRTERSTTAFIRCIRSLHGGMLYLMRGGSTSLFLSAGTIHATITLQGGLLVGINTTSLGSLVSAMRALGYELCRASSNGLPINEILGISQRLICAPELQHEPGKQRSTLAQWPDLHAKIIDAVKRRTEKASSFQDWAVESQEMYSTLQALSSSLSRYTREEGSLAGICCGVANTAEHFATCHLSGMESIHGGAKARGTGQGKRRKGAVAPVPSGD
ncbi:hypothetical protein CLCR_00921 [Cladophialophora carrionii]|uniref:JmjC domain-containing protein n=1 Tax=Cladophialophora carrionii TaxID=86049 RepID=A0A1C1D0L4_9EURO|nr:hypothetical protein CLCR_00921 [Cladophialophora carrionii]